MFDCLESYLKTKFCLGSVDKNRLPGLVLQENMLVRPFLIFITKQGKAKKNVYWISYYLQGFSDIIAA